MNVLARADVGDNFSDVFAVLNHRIAWAEVSKRDLVTEWDRFSRRDRQRRLLIQRCSLCGFACRDVNHRDAHIVPAVMN